MLKILLMFLPYYFHPPEAREMTDRLVPKGFQGNFWGPEAWRVHTQARCRLSTSLHRWPVGTSGAGRYSGTATSCFGLVMRAFCTGFSQ